MIVTDNYNTLPLCHAARICWKLEGFGVRYLKLLLLQRRCRNALAVELYIVHSENEMGMNFVKNLSAYL